MRKLGILLCGMLLTGTSTMFAQGAKNIKINEVLTNNTASLQDEFGQHLPWVELVNTSFSTYNIRGMYITTDRDVLNSSLSAPQRIAKMQVIPNGDERTVLSGRDHLILFLNSNPAKGAMHYATKAEAGQPLWFALYDGNGIDLIDSVSVPALAEDKSYARIKDGELKWDIKPAEAVTPGIGNYIEINETKIARLKRDDPHGFGITVLSMGIVFSCLALLFVFFSILGKIMVRKEKADRASREAGWVKVKSRMPIEAKDSKIPPSKKKEEDIDVYMAVIAMALKEYQDNLHDEESGIITIRPRHTMWNNEL
ncbi:MAG: OadG family protein [Prevotella sp.]|nr:OadG family protein [Prevotella sp.]